ncbi:MAG: ATP-binding protein [Thermoanaerobaculia bacterium]
MIDLGTIAILGEASIVEARNKVRALALAMDYDEITATRLATATSELGRRLLRPPGGIEGGLHSDGGEGRIRVELAGAGEPGGAGLALTFEGTSEAAAADVLGRYFDAVQAVRTDGEDQGQKTVKYQAVKHHPNPAHALSDAFVKRQREHIQTLSREALMLEIQAKNRDLEGHRERLEQTVNERTTELQRAMETAEEANLAKSSFLSNMSHELRTPLNGVLGYAQILQRDPDTTADQRRRLDAIEGCGTHLLALINDVLDLSKIEAGRLELDIAAIDLGQLLRSVDDIIRPRAESSGLSFEIEVAAGLPRGIRTDAAKLRQVLVNLLGNAVKFTREGSVRLSVAKEPAAGEPAAGEPVAGEPAAGEPVAGEPARRLRLDVEDTGAGIASERLTEIFDPFRQAEAGKDSGGTGLGLAISRRLVEALGGELGVDSELGAGSRFTISLPFEEVAEDELDELADDSPDDQRDYRVAPGQEITVLVADDSDTNRDILVSLLETAGFSTVEAANGEEALVRLREHRVPVALVDVRMPIMDGMEATRAIRRDPALRDMVVIAVTASVFHDAREKVMAAGFDDFVPKPFRAAEVFRKIGKHLDVRYLEGGAGVETAPTAVREPPVREPVAADAARALAGRLRQAVDEGDVDALETLGDELRRDAATAGWAAEIVALARDFDFDGVEVLAAELDETQGDRET